MFTWLNKQGVRSSDGFEVQSTGRFAIEYREGARVITVKVEPVYQGVVISEEDAFARWDDSTIVSKDKQARILRNFKDAMSFQGCPVCG